MVSQINLSRRRTMLPRNKLILPLLHFLNQQPLHLAKHYFKHVHKVLMYSRKFTRSRWVDSILDSDTDTRCVNAFRMTKKCFRALCSDLQHTYGLTPSRCMRIEEKVAIFLYIVAHGLGYRAVAERFQRSIRTIHVVVVQVFHALVGREGGFEGLARDIIRPRDPYFTKVPDKIANDSRYARYFKGAIGCIYGTHINACIPETMQQPYRGRKGMPTFNVMAVCDFDMYFTFISAGWEGSAHDARVFDHALSTPGMNFPHPPRGKYYLVDKGYPDKEGYMVPYSKTRYHLKQFEDVQPENSREAFNKVHSSLRSCIERCFGVLKSRWKILRSMPQYPISRQVDIILACVALNNYILRNTEKVVRDESGSDVDDSEDDIEEAENLNDFTPSDDDEDEDDMLDSAAYGCGTRQMRDHIAKLIWSSS